MINLFKKYLLLLLLIFVFSEKVNALPNIYNATYSLQKSGIEFGNSIHNSSYDTESNEWCLKIDSYTVGIFSIKKDNRSEISCFNYDKKKYLEFLDNESIENNFVKSNSYMFS